MRVRFTPSARVQFLEALEYIRRDNRSAAAGFRKKAERILGRLEDHPLSGRVIPEFPELPYREIIIAPYRFFYRIDGKTVWVVAVMHGARDIEKWLKPARRQGYQGTRRHRISEGLVPRRGARRRHRRLRLAGPEPPLRLRRGRPGGPLQARFLDDQPGCAEGRNL